MHSFIYSFIVSYPLLTTSLTLLIPVWVTVRSRPRRTSLLRILRQRRIIRLAQKPLMTHRISCAIRIIPLEACSPPFRISKHLLTRELLPFERHFPRFHTNLVLRCLSWNLNVEESPRIGCIGPEVGSCVAAFPALVRQRRLRHGVLPLLGGVWTVEGNVRPGSSGVVDCVWVL